MRVIICFSTVIAFTTACSCFPQPPKENFCQADFVSRVKVTKYQNPHNDNTGIHDVIYSVTHIKIYKKPPSVYSLPPVVYTPSNGATCGITLDVGKQYLLSGSHNDDGTLHVYICGQVSDDGYGGASLWANVSPALRANLTTFHC
ncbi:hypothetical protein Q1695_003353 [Nippostrongylus brasiliensis]|nr:hypothetical protein Q1695_003353 [Nippostrongylus brasiliensis]